MRAIQNTFTSRHLIGCIRIGACVALGVFGLPGCTSDMKMGQGGSVATGSASDAGAQGASTSLVRCTSKAGTIAVSENPRGYSYIVDYGSLPKSPLPLLKLMLQQTGCFTVVDRGAGPHYTLIPDVIFTANTGGGLGGAVAAYIPRAPVTTPIAGGMKFREAQVVLMLTDNNTTERIAAAEGSAKATDFGIGGGLIGTLDAAAVGGWGNTNEGKVVAAAMMDGINKLVPQIREMGPADAIPAKRR